MRTLLVFVAVLAASCAWIAGQTKIVQARKAAIEEVEANRGWVAVGSRFYGSPRTIPFWRYWLGDDHVIKMELRESYAERVGLARTDEIVGLFPEAEMIFFSQGWGGDLQRGVPSRFVGLIVAGGT